MSWHFSGLLYYRYKEEEKGYRFQGRRCCLGTYFIFIFFWQRGLKPLKTRRRRRKLVVWGCYFYTLLKSATFTFPLPLSLSKTSLCSQTCLQLKFKLGGNLQDKYAVKQDAIHNACRTCVFKCVYSHIHLFISYIFYLLRRAGSRKTRCVPAFSGGGEKKNVSFGFLYNNKGIYKVFKSWAYVDVTRFMWNRRRCEPHNGRIGMLFFCHDFFSACKFNAIFMQKNSKKQLSSKITSRFFNG